MSTTSGSVQKGLLGPEFAHFFVQLPLAAVPSLRRDLPGLDIRLLVINEAKVNESFLVLLLEVVRQMESLWL